MSCSMTTNYFQIKDFIDSKLAGVWQGPSSNQYAAEPCYLKPEPGNEKLFNEIYCYLCKTDLNTIIRTKSGAIAKNLRAFTNNNYAWDLQKSSIGAMLTIILGGFIYVIKFGNYKTKNEPEIYPNQAFTKFSDKCLEYGIDIDNYKITNGPEVKQTIESPMIQMLEYQDENHPGLTNVHHIDFHNSYPAGLANTHPEFRPIIEHFYNLRNSKDEHISTMSKAVLNYTVGWMQSTKNNRKAEWAHLSRDAIADNNRRIEKLACILEFTGRKIIGYNTDGIWYQGNIYHGPGEGKELGQWENDYVNCTFRAKSDGAYEFFGTKVKTNKTKYVPVIRGQTTLEASKDREDWTWGDIYKTGIIGWKFDEEKGVYFNEI